MELMTNGSLVVLVGAAVVGPAADRGVERVCFVQVVGLAGSQAETQVRTDQSQLCTEY